MNNSENLPTDNNNKSIVKGKTMYNWETHDNQDKVILDSINAIDPVMIPPFTPDVLATPM